MNESRWSVSERDVRMMWILLQFASPGALARWAAAEAGCPWCWMTNHTQAEDLHSMSTDARCEKKQDVDVDIGHACPVSTINIVPLLSSGVHGHQTPCKQVLCLCTVCPQLVRFVPNLCGLSPTCTVCPQLVRVVPNTHTCLRRRTSTPECHAMNMKAAKQPATCRM